MLLFFSPWPLPWHVLECNNEYDPWAPQRALRQAMPRARPSCLSVCVSELVRQLREDFHVAKSPHHSPRSPSPRVSKERLSRRYHKQKRRGMQIRKSNSTGAMKPWATSTERPRHWEYPPLPVYVAFFVVVFFVAPPGLPSPIHHCLAMGCRSCDRQLLSSFPPSETQNKRLPRRSPCWRSHLDQISRSAGEDIDKKRDSTFFCRGLNSKTSNTTLWCSWYRWTRFSIAQSMSMMSCQADHGTRCCCHGKFIRTGMRSFVWKTVEGLISLPYFKLRELVVNSRPMSAMIGFLACPNKIEHAHQLKFRSQLLTTGRGLHYLEHIFNICCDSVINCMIST